MYIARTPPALNIDKPEQLMSINLHEVRQWAQWTANRHEIPIRVFQIVETEVDYILPNRQEIKVNASDSI